ncbi:hypothetical protein [Blastococcus sp. TF02A-35]|uniref:hypothetical protein n=1 Tax=Blastococcus sp. TF02A-35 TaxID=2559612 RepID=UPI0010749C1E|nr:hypothetical protein [Blastococcus sp. TF02A_35]TFV52476.1 hypothetical protein E4P43_05635 [Blastococcus sp. TF02A_35]
MSQPPHTPEPAPSTDGQAAPGWPAPEPAWPAPGTQPAPDWAATAPTWQQPAPVAAPQPAPAATPAGRGRWVAAGAALAGLAAGAVGATFLMTAVVAGTSEDMGRALAGELAPAIAEGVQNGMLDATEQSMGALLEEESMGWYAEPPGGEVEQFPPVAPKDLGPDEVLDEYAQSCFEGDFQACDDLLYESPPLSAYEEYAGTCGGRVKEFAVPVCTELE